MLSLYCALFLPTQINPRNLLQRRFRLFPSKAWEDFLPGKQFGILKLPTAYKTLNENPVLSGL